MDLFETLITIVGKFVSHISIGFLVTRFLPYKHSRPNYTLILGTIFLAFMELVEIITFVEISEIGECKRWSMLAWWILVFTLLFVLSVNVLWNLHTVKKLHHVDWSMFKIYVEQMAVKYCEIVKGICAKIASKVCCLRTRQRPYTTPLSFKDTMATDKSFSLQ